MQFNRPDMITHASDEPNPATPTASEAAASEAAGAPTDAVHAAQEQPPPAPEACPEEPEQ